MWKTRFEMSTSNSDNFIRHRTLSSSSSIIQQHYSRPSPTVPRVREDSPSAIVRPSPPSSIPSLEILPEEEDEDIPCLISTTNEQPNSLSITLRKQNSYQLLLPTIIESHDHEMMLDHMSNKESTDDRHSDVYLVPHRTQDSFAATNTNYNQTTNSDVERQERKLEATSFTINKRISELLQQKNQRKSIENELSFPTTFKDISAFFEDKALVLSSTRPNEHKKMIRAKRSRLLNRSIPIDNDQLFKADIRSSTEEESSIFHRQIKRIKKTHQTQRGSITKSESIRSDCIAERSDICDQNNSKPSLIITTPTQRWFLLLVVANIVFIYFYISQELFPLHSVVSRQPNEPAVIVQSNLVSQYGEFTGNCFFSIFEFFGTLMGQIFFRIDKYEYKNRIVYVASITYEYIYDWFIHLFK